jgi:hypothetical protein
MAYIKKFGLKNFRVFQNEQDFDLAPITLLTGLDIPRKVYHLFRGKVYHYS